MKNILFKTCAAISRFFKIVLCPKIYVLMGCNAFYVPLGMLMIPSMGLCPINHYNVAHHWIENTHKDMAISTQSLSFSQHCALLQQHHRNCFTPLRSRGICDPFSEMTMIKRLCAIRSGTL
jgi:hypothetical protein